MKTYIALLRGINVAGQKKIPMAELRDLLSKSGLENVQTYIQSGNVIFQSSEVNRLQLEAKIYNVILSYFGFEVPVLIMTRSDLQRVFDNCPFSEAQKTKSYFTMLYAKPDADLVAIASDKTYPNEAFQIINNCIYFYCANGYGRAKFNGKYFERTLKTFATARNYKTMVKLLSLSDI